MFSKTLVVCGAVLLVLSSTLVLGQVGTGTITGTVSDSTGAVIPNAALTITNPTTAATRSATANAQGLYSAPALPAGTYQVKVEVSGFSTVERDAQVTAGSETTLNIEMSVGQSTQTVAVEAASAQINYDSAAFTGSVERQSVQDLPLNGRSFLQLATLEPGVTVAAGSASARNAPIGVTMLGGASGASGIIRLDGLSIWDVYEGGVMMNFSQEMVQEFQIATLNYDISNSFTAVGSVNIVSRSGGNDFHGSAFYFYRDHNMAAYPALKRSALFPNPFFQRRNPGGWVSGPVIKNRLFFFFDYEVTDQVQSISTQQDLAPLQPLNAIYPSPQTYHSLNFRFDYHLNDKTTLFARYTHDGNHSFGVNGGTSPEPSNWLNNNNWSDQYAFGATTTISPTLVNDFRAGYVGWIDKIKDANAAECPSPCMGTGLPQVNMLGSATLETGNNSLGNNERFLHTLDMIDTLSWQKGTHQLRFGAEVDYQWFMFQWSFCIPGVLDVIAPSVAAATAGFPASSLAALPTSIRTNQDVLNLPVYNIVATEVTGIGVGPGFTPGPWNYGPNASEFKPNFYASDSWKLRPNLTVNYGLGWQFQSGGIYNSDMSKPAFLQPLAGPLGGLSPSQVPYNEFAPSFGFAWSPGKSGKWVIRGGAGGYYDTIAFATSILQNTMFGPVGNGPTSVSAGVFTNIFPGIVEQTPSGFQPLPIGAPLPTLTISNMTLGQFMQIYNQQFPALNALLSPPVPKSGSYTLTDLDYVKNMSQIFPHHYPMVHSYQTSVGIQRDLGHNMVLTVDWARRQFVHSTISAPGAGGIDLNHSNEYINGVLSPAIPFCTPSQLFIPGQECSTGVLSMEAPYGRTIYEAMLLKLSKRFSNHFQFLVSYALQNDDSDNVVINYNNFMQSYGPILARHNLNASGLVQLKYGFELALNSSIITQNPVTPTIAGIDLNGTGADPSAPLAESGFAGITYNCFNFGCSKTQLADAVAQWNSTLAGTKAPSGATIPKLTLPASYGFGPPTIAQDVRLTKTFTYKERYRLLLMGELFNAINHANLTAYNFTIGSAFGQATQRSPQSFLSGGPRALQVGARFQF